MDMKKEIYDLLKKNGGRLTNQRKIILAALLQNTDRMLSVSDVAAEIPQESNIDNTTVYRNIQQLHDLGILESIIDSKGINRYVLAKSGSHHHHLICVYCGKVFSIPCKKKYWAQYARDNGFHELYHKLEVYGECEKCKDQGQTC